VKKTSLIVCTLSLLALLFSFSSPFSLHAEPEQVSKEPAINFILRDTFYFSPDLKIKYNTYESDGFLLIKEKRPDMNSKFSIVSGFDGAVLESLAMKNVNTIEEAHIYLKKNAKVTRFMNVMIKDLPLPKKDSALATHYWIGEKSYPSIELAQASIVAAKTAVETRGGDFERAIKLSEEFSPMEPKVTTEEEVASNYQQEEKLAIKAMDWLHVGDKLWGPLNTPGYPYGEPVLWQSFGESSFRFTNLSHQEYNSQVSFWVNRIVLKGIRAPFGTTLDPYLEVTPSLETNGLNFPSNLVLTGGIEWYPLIRNVWLQNYRGIGDVPWLDFVRGYRFYIQYMHEENLKDEIVGTKDYDVRAGIDIFKEWGLELPKLGSKPIHNKFMDYVNDYVWGEYYGSYHYEATDLSPLKDFNSFIVSNSLALGVKWPSIPLPHNSVNNEFLLMPYLRFEEATNMNHPLSYQNYYFVAAGLRWMPFRSYEYMDNEWLFKCKIFFEYIGMGGVFRPSANTAIDTPIRDYRIGINFSHRRF